MFFETVDVMPEAPAYELFNHPQSSMSNPWVHQLQSPV